MKRFTYSPKVALVAMISAGACTMAVLLPQTALAQDPASAEVEASSQQAITSENNSNGPALEMTASNSVQNASRESDRKSVV